MFRATVARRRPGAAGALLRSVASRPIRWTRCRDAGCSSSTAAAWRQRPAIAWRRNCRTSGRCLLAVLAASEMQRSHGACNPRMREDEELVKILGDTSCQVLICQATCPATSCAPRCPRLALRHTITTSALDYLEHRPGSAVPTGPPPASSRKHEHARRGRPPGTAGAPRRRPKPHAGADYGDDVAFMVYASGTRRASPRPRSTPTETSFSRHRSTKSGSVSRRLTRFSVWRRCFTSPASSATWRWRF